MKERCPVHTSETIENLKKNKESGGNPANDKNSIKIRFCLA
jgi:hypothetical protein